MTQVSDHTVVQIPTLHTERLIMRAPKRSDMAALDTFRTSERSRGVGGPFASSSTHEKLCALVGHWHIEGYGRWIVADHNDTPLGLVGLLNPDGWPEPEIGWSLFAEAEGKGIAYEAAIATRTYVYDVLGWPSVISCVAPDNTRSLALAKRLGATHEGEFQHADHGTLQIFRHPMREAA